MMRERMHEVLYGEVVYAADPDTWLWQGVAVAIPTQRVGLPAAMRELFWCLWEQLEARRAESGVPTVGLTRKEFFASCEYLTVDTQSALAAHAPAYTMARGVSVRLFIHKQKRAFSYHCHFHRFSIPHIHSINPRYIGHATIKQLLQRAERTIRADTPDAARDLAQAQCGLLTREPYPCDSGTGRMASYRTEQIPSLLFTAATMAVQAPGRKYTELRVSNSGVCRMWVFNSEIQPDTPGA